MTLEDIEAKPGRFESYRKTLEMPLELGQLVANLHAETGLTEVQILYAISVYAYNNLKKMKLSSRWKPPGDED